MIANRLATLLTLMLALTSNAHAQVWATAISKHHSNGTVIVYRYMKEFRQGFVRAEQPDRIIIVWRYSGTKGLPSADEKARMDELEDALAPLEQNGFSTLALVSTGVGLREWTYYAQSEEAFFSRLNLALREKQAFPIEIHAGADPAWTSYDAFATGVKDGPPKTGK